MRQAVRDAHDRYTAAISANLSMLGRSRVAAAVQAVRSAGMGPIGVAPRAPCAAPPRADRPARVQPVPADATGYCWAPWCHCFPPPGAASGELIAVPAAQAPLELVTGRISVAAVAFPRHRASRAVGLPTGQVAGRWRPVRALSESRVHRWAPPRSQSVHGMLQSPLCQISRGSPPVLRTSTTSPGMTKS